MAKRGENLYKRKDGRYEGRYIKGRKPDGKPVFGYVYGRRYHEVRSALLIKKAEYMSACAALTDHGYTLSSWTEHWLESEVMPSVKPSSYQTYLNLYHRHLKPILGHIRLSVLSREMIQGFIDFLEHEGFAANTIKGAARLLAASLNDAVEQDVLKKTPYRKIVIRQAEICEQRVLSLSEQNLIRSRPANIDNLPALLGLYCGMRLGEVCALKWADINWENKTISVRRTVQRVQRKAAGNSKSVLLVGTPKSLKSHRVLPVPDFLMDILKQLLPPANNDEYIFGNCCAAEPRTVQRRLKRITESLGMQGVHFHTLRHTFATRLLELGCDIKTVSDLLGHSSVKLTLDFYVHSQLENQRKAVHALAAC